MAENSKASLIARLLTETWPARAVQSASNAFALPGQVAGGAMNVQPATTGMWSDEDEARAQATQETMMGRAADLAGMLTLGAGAVPGGANELRAGIRPYQNVPQPLMGYGKNDMYKGKSFDTGGYSHVQPVEVVFPGGEVLRDAVKGLNPDHAVERAYRNWPDAWHIRGTK